MPQLTCIDPNEQAIDVAFESGETILQATHRAGVDGILAECGGGCLRDLPCYFDLGLGWNVDAPSPQEADMLSSQSTQHRSHALPVRYNSMSNTTGSRSQSQNVSIDEYRDCRGWSGRLYSDRRASPWQFVGRYRLERRIASAIPASPVIANWLHNPTDTESIRLFRADRNPCVG